MKTKTMLMLAAGLLSLAGSVTPSSRRRNSREASSYWSLILKWRPNTSRTTSASRPRSRPLFTKMQVSWSPMAFLSKAAAQAENHAFLADLRADGCHGLVNVVVHGPRLAAAADAMHEVGDDCPAARGVGHLRVELQSEHLPGAVLDGGVGGVFRDGHRFEAGG